MAMYNDFIESADALRRVAEEFDRDLRDGLKAELMRLAEARVDTIVDETVKGLQTKLDGMRDMQMQRSVIQITIRRQVAEK